MRIALDGTSLIGPRTGVGAVVEAITTGLAATEGVELTTLVVSRRAGADLASHLPAGVGLRRLALPAAVCHRLWRSIDHPAVRGFDVVHGPNYVVPPAGGGAELLTIHDLTPWQLPELAAGATLAFPALVRRAVARGAHVHAVSSFVAAEVVDHLGVPAEPVHAIPNGVAPGLAGDAAAGRSLAGGHPYVLAVGTIEPRKDHPTLVEAFASLRSSHPELRLVIAGPDGWGVEAYDDAVRRTGVASAIVRLGFVSEQTKADLLAGASVFAYPSRYEGFGLPPLEAAAAGVPVVATDAGAIPEVMADGASIVAVGDAAALAAAVDRALTDDDLRRRLVAAGHLRVQRHGWPEAVARLVELYRRIAGA